MPAQDTENSAEKQQNEAAEMISQAASAVLPQAANAALPQDASAALPQDASAAVAQDTTVAASQNATAEGANGNASPAPEIAQAAGESFEAKVDRLLADLENKRYPEHIEALKINDDFKRQFTLFEALHVVQTIPGLPPSLPKRDNQDFRTLPFNKRWSVVKLLTSGKFSYTLLTMLFGSLYYFFTGMWRKGLVLLPITLVLGTALRTGIDLCYILITETAVPDSLSRNFDMTVAMALGYLCGRLAPYDRYRTLVKKETFWW